MFAIKYSLQFKDISQDIVKRPTEIVQSTLSAQYNV